MSLQPSASLRTGPFLQRTNGLHSSGGSFGLVGWPHWRRRKLRERLAGFVRCRHLAGGHHSGRKLFPPLCELTPTSVQLPTGRAIIQLSEEANDNCILLVPGANYAPQSALPDSFAGYSLIVVQNEIPLEHTAKALRMARPAGLQTLFNPSPMLTPAQCLDFNWRSVDYLVVNSDERTALYTAFDCDLAGESQNLSFPMFCSRSGFGGALFCTKGPEGVSVAHSKVVHSDASWSFEVPAGRLERPVVNTVGLGCVRASTLI
jgi:sugar/nucleoside kinase (ribokinase family)